MLRQSTTRCIPLLRRSMESRNQCIVRYLQSARENVSLSNNMNFREARLGTMSFEQVNQALCSTNELFQGKEFPRQGLEFADFMVHRLGAEYASGSTIAQQFTNEVYFLHCFLLSVYHEELSLTNPQPDKLNRAERLLRRLASLYLYLDNDDPAVEDPPPVGIIVTLVKSWLKLNDEKKAVGLLIWWTAESQDDELELSPLFREALLHCFSVEDEKLTRLILARMKELKSDFGWNSFNESSTSIGNEHDIEDIDKMTSPGTDVLSYGEFMDSTSADSSKGSEIRVSVLTEEIIEFAKVATIHDEQKIHRYVDKLMSVPGLHTSDQFYEALVDYYVKIKNGKEAIFWLQRLDQASVSGCILNKFEDVLQVIEDDTKESHSSMRAMELFQRMEYLESEGRGVVSINAYNRICRIFMKTRDLHAKKKMEEILRRIFSMTGKNSDGNLPNEDSFDILLANKSGRSEIQEALQCLARNWNDNMDTESKKNVAGKFMSKLARHGMATEAETLLALCLQTKVPLQNPILEDYLMTHVRSSDPNRVFNEISRLVKSQGTLPFDCYAKTILKLPSYGFIDREKEMALLTSVLSLINNGELVVSNEDGRKFVEESTNNLRLQKRHLEGELVLSLLEDSSCSDTTNLQLLSVKSFNNIMMACMKANEFGLVQSLFDRLLGHYKAGNTRLVPDSVSHSIYLNTISRQPKCASKAEETLKEFLRLHSSIQTEEMKPDESHFTLVLTALRRELPPDLVSRTLTLIDQMQKRDMLSVTFMSGNVLRTILQSSLNTMKDAEKSRFRAIMTELEMEPSELNSFLPINAPRLNSGVKMVEQLPKITAKDDSHKISEEDLQTGADSVIRLMKNMSDNDDVEIPFNRLCHQLKLSSPQTYNNKNVGGYWILEAFKAGKIFGFKRAKGRDVRLCLQENIEKATAPYPSNSMDTLKEEQHLIAFLEANGGCVPRTEAIKYLAEEFRSMHGPFQRTKLLMNAYKRGTLYLRKSNTDQVIALTPEQANAEVIKYYETSDNQSNEISQPLNNPEEIIYSAEESFFEKISYDQEVAI